MADFMSLVACVPFEASSLYICLIYLNRLQREQLLLSNVLLMVQLTESKVIKLSALQTLIF